jgi:hypothetical protein
MRVYLCGLVVLLACHGRAAADKWVQRCADGTHESQRAHADLDQLGERIDALALDGDQRPLEAALRALLASRCFRVAGDDLERDEFDGALSLITWWKSGGRSWLSSVLGSPRELVLPPDPRSTLAPDGKVDQPPPLVSCRAIDPDCGRETNEWAERAQAALLARARSASETDSTDDADTAAAPRSAADCEPRARRRPAIRRYLEWRQCIRELHPTQTALPLGQMRAPARGWFVVRGRRGHYSFCDELRAYDLATGSAYVAKSCSGLALGEHGSVDRARTDAGRRREIVTGRLPVDRLREAVWMALLSTKVQHHVHIDLYRAIIPAGIAPRFPDGDRSGFGGIGLGWVSSAQTRLGWAWLDGGRVLAKGELTWPNSSDAGDDYAVELLRVAEGGLTPGCPSAALPPARLLGDRSPGVNRLDAPAGVASIEEELMDALDHQPSCERSR